MQLFNLSPIKEGHSPAQKRWGNAKHPEIEQKFIYLNFSRKKKFYKEFFFKQANTLDTTHGMNLIN